MQHIECELLVVSPSQALVQLKPEEMPSRAFQLNCLNQAFDLIGVAHFKEDCRKRDRAKQCDRSGRR